MEYPQTMSIIVVQLDADHPPAAYVSYGSQGGQRADTRRELTLHQVKDWLDAQMWAQMCTAAVCDEI